MNKEYDTEKINERKYKINDRLFNAFLLLLASLIIAGLIFLFKKYAGLIVIALLIVGVRLYSIHHDSENYWSSKSTKRKLQQPKFNYLSDEQIQEIIREIYYF